MSESPQYEAFRAFARAHIALEVRNATDPLKEEIRSLRSQLDTRSIEPKVIEGPAGKDGKDGRGIARIYIQPDGILAVRYTDGTEEYSAGKVVGEKGERGEPGIGEKGERGADGINGKDGAPSTVPGPKGDPGERGKDGIATREELESIVEQRFADVQVRSFADIYQGVYDPAKTYTRGNLATWGGSLWLSKSDTRTKPGESSDWQLVVKRGADGKSK